MPLPLELQRFLKAHHDTQVLSVLVEGASADPSVRRHWRIEVLRGIADARAALFHDAPPDRVRFDQCVARLMRHLPSGSTRLFTHGWAGFASADGDEYVEVLTRDVEPSVTWTVGPRILPYLAAHDESVALVALGDRHRLLAYQLSRGALTDLEWIESAATSMPGTHMGGAPRVGFHVGTRGATQADAADRAAREAWHRHVTASVQRITQLAGDNLAIVIGGASETVSLLADGLPDDLSTRVALAPALQVHASRAEIVRVAGAAVGSLEAARQRALLRQVEEASWSRGHGALGAEAVARALEVGAVDRLLVGRAFAHQHRATAELLAQRTLLDGGEVEVAVPAVSAAVDEGAWGVAARLRFARSPARALQTA